MSAQQEIDELFDIKNSFYIGNYQKCINEAQNIKLNNPDLILEKDTFLYRALICQKKYGVVLSEIKDKFSPSFKALRLLARYFQKIDDGSDISVELEAILKDNGNADCHMVLILAANIYCVEGNYEAALRILNQSNELECRALMIHAYLQIHRLDAAKKELKLLQEKDDDATLTQLAQAWILIATGGEKLQDAYYIYQELIDKNTSTSLLLNGQAVCFLGQGKFEEAESSLQEALEKDPNNADTLINLMFVSHHMSKGKELTARCLAQLNEDFKESQFVQDMNTKKEEFRRMVASFH